ncbi:MAG: adenylate/guanylate cyclase domain-containing protein [Syntrophobacteraceae bacterium]
MKCRKCLSDIPPNARFCIECGTPNDFSCPNCGTVTPRTGRFCMGCGASLDESKPAALAAHPDPQSYTPKFLAQKILTTRTSIEGERKLVTVFFADVVNSTGIAEKLGPDRVHEIMDGTFKILMNEIHKVEGTINQFTGDGVMALFGAPLAHEDHAQRACHAALCIRNTLQDYSREIEDRFGVNFSMRIGLNSGPVIVGAIGDDLRMDYTAIGDTTNLAARMQSMADPGAVLVTKHTQRLAKDFFEFKSLGRLPVKGKAELQETFELVRSSEVKSRMDACMARGLTKFVGRTRSINKLTDAYEEARSGKGQVVGIVGEPGVGKSRMLFEFRNLMSQDEFTYLEGRCLHYGGATAYLPILDIVRSYFEIASGDTQSLIKEKIDQKISAHERLRDSIPLLLELLSSESEMEDIRRLDPRHKRMKTFEALRDLLILGGQGKMVVLALEDLHWIDKTSEEFINYLIPFVQNRSILFLFLYRPEYIPKWEKMPFCSRINLSQLDTKSCIKLAQAILQNGEISSDLNSLILGKSSGNPLFIEELTRTLLEEGSIEERGGKYLLNRKATEIMVPDTIQGLIAARIDRLDESIKKTMQVASVIGRDFPYRILQVITGMEDELKAHLLSLQCLELIYEKEFFPEVEFNFKHALTQEVAYTSLLIPRRKELHRRIGEAMESIYGDRFAEYSSIIGEHFFRAEVWDRAFYYLDKSGDTAARLFALPEAVTHYGQALRALERLDPTEANSMLRVDTIVKYALSSWRSDAPEQNLSLLAEAERIMTMPAAEMSNTDKLRLARVRFCIGRIHYLQGDMAEAIDSFKQVLPIARASNDMDLTAIPSSAIGQTMAILGHLAEAKTLLSQAIELFENTANWAEWIQAMCFLGSASAGTGNYSEGLTMVERALERGQEINFPTGISAAYNGFGFVHLFGGDLRQSIASVQKAVETAKSSGDLTFVYVGYGLWGWAAGRSGDLDTAAACMTHSREVAQQLGGRVIMSDLFTAVRAEIAFSRKDFHEARKLAKQAIKLAQAIGGVLAEGIAKRVLGQVNAEFASTGEDDVFAEFRESLRLLESGENSMEAARTRRVWGALSNSRGDLTSAAEHWTKAAARFKTAGATRELNEVMALMVESGIAEPDLKN